MEKRKYERAPLSMEAKINRNHSARVVDVSKSGIRLRGKPLSRGENIGISLLSGNRSIPLFGQVRWTNNASPSSGEAGVQISNAPFGYYQFLDDLFAYRKINRGLLLWPLLLAIFLVLLLILLF